MLRPIGTEEYPASAPQIEQKTTLQARADEVQKLCLEVLATESSEREIYRKGAVEDWMNGDARLQLAQYVDSKETQQRFGLAQRKKLQAYVVTFIGPQKISLA